TGIGVMRESFGVTPSLRRIKRVLLYSPHPHNKNEKKLGKKSVTFLQTLKTIKGRLEEEVKLFDSAGNDSAALSRVRIKMICSSEYWRKVDGKTPGATKERKRRETPVKKKL
ncbi:Uncharacterized protein DAT39_021599, partial [Clarias magur]